MLHWVIYDQHFRTVLWSRLHWTFYPCQWHHHMSKTLCTNHPVVWHDIQRNLQISCVATGLDMWRIIPCYEDLKHLRILYTIFLDLKYTLYNSINCDSKPTPMTWMHHLAQHIFMVYIRINHVIFDNFKACESQHYFAGGM